MANDGLNGKETPELSVAPSISSSEASGATLLAQAPANIPEAISVAGLKMDGNTIYTGPVLRQIRESQRITLKEVSERTKISVASLSALEEERYDDLPNARVYVRGFVRCLAAEIGLDKDLVSRTYVPRWEAWFYDQTQAPR